VEADMSTPKVVVKVQKAETMQEEMGELYDRIAHRAYEVYLERGALAGCDVENWLAAEHELVWKPAVEILEKNEELMIQVAIAGIEPGDLIVRMTEEHLLIKSEQMHTHGDERGIVHVCEFRSGPVFRTIHFPKRVDPASVEVDYRNGLLRLTAALANEKLARDAA
jgi:HSP20 family molecular chaperone IbpA